MEDARKSYGFFICTECGRHLNVVYDKREWLQFIQAGEVPCSCIACNKQVMVPLDDQRKADIIRQIPN